MSLRDGNLEFDKYTQENGYKYGKPAGRGTDPLDVILAQAISKIPPATRMYPDIYSWQLTDAIKAMHQNPHYETQLR